MSGEDSTGIELDNCTEWILEHNQSFHNTGVPQHLEIEWMNTCVGHQRLVTVTKTKYKSQLFRRDRRIY